MSEQKHTPEPWEYGHGLPGIFVPHQINEDGDVDFDVIAPTVSTEANARRIVACVNACRGTETEKLEHKAEVFSALLEKSIFTVEALDDAILERDEARADADRYKRKLDEAVGFAEALKQWSEAYPTTVFREPDPENVRKVCESLGCTLDAISAMVLRVFTKPWGDKARAFLARIAEAEKGDGE